MTLHTPTWLQAGSYSGDADRSLIDALYVNGGVIAGGDLLVTQRGSGANMSVDVAAGKVVVVGTDVSGQNKYLCWSDAVTNVPIATAPGTGLFRIDLIVATVRDSDAIGGSNNDWIIQRVAGTAGSSPIVPAIPASSTILAQVHVGPNVTSIVTANCTDLRAFIGPTFTPRRVLAGVSVGVLPPPDQPLLEIWGDIVLAASGAAVTFSFSSAGFGPFNYGYLIQPWLDDGGTGGVSQIVLIATTSDLSGCTLDAFEPDGTPYTGAIHLGYQILGA